MLVTDGHLNHECVCQKDGIASLNSDTDFDFLPERTYTLFKIGYHLASDLRLWFKL